MVSKLRIKLVAYLKSSMKSMNTNASLNIIEVNDDLVSVFSSDTGICWILKSELKHRPIEHFYN
jgi:hypothetical protein